MHKLKHSSTYVNRVGMGESREGLWDQEDGVFRPVEGLEDLCLE